MTYSCPDCHRKPCFCDMHLCDACEDCYVHIDDALACGVPGCPNDILCSTQCYELVEGIPVCTDCVNALDADWRLLAVRRLAARRIA